MDSPVNITNSAGRLKDTLDNLDVALVIVDGNGIILFINDYGEAYQYLLSDKPAIGSSVFAYIDAEWQPMARMMMDNVKNSGLPVSVDLQRGGKRGSKFFFELTCRNIPASEDGSSTFLIQVRDITPRKIFERKLELVGSEMSNLIENANAIIIAADGNDYITEWNKATSEITGYLRHEAIMKNLSGLIVSPSEQDHFKTVMHEVMKGKSVANFELPVLAKNGAELTFLINGTPRLNAMGQVIGILIVGQDITELTAHRTSLERLVEERTRELNNSYEEVRLQKTLVDGERKKSDQLLLNILPAAVASELKEKGHVVPRFYKTATILFADMVGFTTMGTKLSPNELIYELSYVFTGFDFILEKHRMEKIKTIGDGYLAVGGVPAENDTNAVDAVTAATEMIEFTRRLRSDNKKSGKPEWEVRIGIHTGSLVAGVIGKTKFAYDVWGASVNTASRIESASEKGKVNISEMTYNDVKDRFRCTFRGEIQVKSLGMVKMYFVD